MESFLFGLFFIWIVSAKVVSNICFDSQITNCKGRIPETFQIDALDSGIRFPSYAFLRLLYIEKQALKDRRASPLRPSFPKKSLSLKCTVIDAQGLCILEKQFLLNETPNFIFLSKSSISHAGSELAFLML